MATGLLLDVSTVAPPSGEPTGLDPVQALCQDLRQPLAAIRLLAGAEGGHLQFRLDAILAQAEWLSDIVEGVVGSAADPSS